MINSKTGELECLAVEGTLDIISITETCWNNKNQWDILMPDYKLYRNVRLG